MKTVRDHIAGTPGIPDPPPGATHVLVWEPYGPSRSQWVLGVLDGAPDDDVALFDGPADEHPGVLGEQVMAVLGCPVEIHCRFECDGEFAHYVTAAGAS